MAVLELDTKHRVGQGLGDGPFQDNRIFFGLRQFFLLRNGPRVRVHARRIQGQLTTLPTHAQQSNLPLLTRSASTRRPDQPGPDRLGEPMVGLFFDPQAVDGKKKVTK